MNRKDAKIAKILITFRMYRATRRVEGFVGLKAASCLFQLADTRFDEKDLLGVLGALSEAGG